MTFNPVADISNFIINLFSLSSDASQGITAIVILMVCMMVLVLICAFVVKLADKLGLIE